jgi:hypothetical protein
MNDRLLGDLLSVVAAEPKSADEAAERAEDPPDIIGLEIRLFSPAQQEPACRCVERS